MRFRNSAAAAVGVLATGLALGGCASAVSQSQTKQVVELTNQGSSACTMDGSPGVDLVGVARGKHDYSWSLARRPGRHSKVPPNDHTQAALAWSPFVLLQDKTAHPGTYISPIVPGS